MQKFSGRGYHKIITIADETGNFFPITLDGVGFLIGTNDDLNVVDVTTVKSNFIYDLENNKTYQVYSSDKDIWVYFSDDFGSVTLLDYTDKTTLPASFDDVIKLSDINLANFPDGSGGGGTVLASDVETIDGSNAQVKFDEIESGTPIISIADTTASVVISQTVDTTFMQMLTTSFENRSTDYFSYSGDTVTILKDGFYQITLIANCEKSGTGGVFIDGSLTVGLLVNNVRLKNTSLTTQINSAGTIAPVFTGSLQLSSNDTLRVNFLDSGTGTLTATTTADHDSFIFQIKKI